MRDCPACRVPLHGYEEVCPSCGTKQHPQSSRRLPYGAEWRPEEPKVNPVPIILVLLVGVVFLIASAQSTWIGQLMRQGNKEPDPMDKLTYTDARSAIESTLTQNLTTAGATKTKLTWHLPGATPGAPGAKDQGDPRGVDGPIELTVDTSLPAPELRKQIVDPAKPYFEKAKLFTLEMNDSRSKHHWTYTMTPGTAPADPDSE